MTPEERDKRLAELHAQIQACNAAETSFLAAMQTAAEHLKKSYARKRTLMREFDQLTSPGWPLIGEKFEHRISPSGMMVDTLVQFVSENLPEEMGAPLHDSCIVCGEGLDDENISDFCSQECEDKHNAESKKRRCLASTGPAAIREYPPRCKNDALPGSRFCQRHQHLNK